MKRMICRMLSSDAPVFTGIGGISWIIAAVFVLCKDSITAAYVLPIIWIPIFSVVNGVFFISPSNGNTYPVSFLEKNFKYIKRLMVMNLLLIWLYILLFYFPGWVTWILFLLNSFLVFIAMIVMSHNLGEKYKGL